MFWRRSKVSAEDRAVLDLKRQRDKIKQYQKRIATVVDREHELARSCLAAGDRQRALVLLRRKKYQQQLLQKTDDQLATLEELTSSIEFAQIQKDVLFGLEQGARVLTELNAQMSLERVDKIMDDSAEGIEYQRQVSDMLAANMTAQDELEVEDELEELERDAGIKPNHLEQTNVQKLPNAPSEPIESPEQVEPETNQLLAT